MQVEKDSVAERAYDTLKEMCVNYLLKPGERINEVTLSKELKVSRTPLREALSRLLSESLLEFVPGKGFYCRRFDEAEIVALYETRGLIERQAIRLSVVRASDEAIDRITDFLHSTGPSGENYSTEELVRFDEHFHEELMKLSGNPVLLEILRNINTRIRFIRWIKMSNTRRLHTQDDHMEILMHLKKRDADTCDTLMQAHIEMRKDEIISSMKDGLHKIYSSRPMTELA